MGYRLELPDIGEGVVEAEVQRWFVAPGDVVEEDQPLVELEDVSEAPAPPAEARGDSPEPARPGDAARADFGPPRGEPPAARASPAASPAGGAEAGVAAPKALATPAVRAMARELGVDVNAVPGTGPGGRVTKEDLDAFRGRRNGHAAPAREALASSFPSAASAPVTPTGPGQPPRVPAVRPPEPPAMAPRGPEARPPVAAPAPVAELRPRPVGAPADERLPLRGIRRSMAEHMARSKRTAAHFTFVEQADVTELVRLRERMAPAAQEEGVKLTFLPFVVKAVVAGLRKHPKLNASLDEERHELVLHKRYDIGIAASTGQGLVVPVARGADGRSLLDLAREIDRLAADAKAGRSRPEDVGRSTFTVTSLGALGGLFATPILNFPEVGILGIHRIRPTPVVRDGQVVARDVMHVSVTCDHRVVDGHEAAAFCYEVIRALEDPEVMFLRMV